MTTRIPAADLQSGDRFVHARTRPTAGDYTVVRVSTWANGATTIRVTGIDRNGAEFEGTVMYLAGEEAEVVG